MKTVQMIDNLKIIKKTSYHQPLIMKIALEIAFMPNIPGYIVCRLFEHDDEISEGDVIYCFEAYRTWHDILKQYKILLEPYGVIHKVMYGNQKQILYVDDIMVETTFNNLYKQYKNNKLPQKCKQLTSLLTTYCKLVKINSIL